MANHIPGPWKFEASTKTIRSVPANYWLATMNSWDGAVNHEANAKVIAAAPELLEALLAFKRVAEICTSGGQRPSRDHFLDVLRQADKAITKAVGEG